jgi:uncharacterized protein with GYD domain
MDIAVMCEMCSTGTSLLGLRGDWPCRAPLARARGLSSIPYIPLQFAEHRTSHLTLEDSTMQTYVSLVKFTQHGLQSMKDKGIERAEAVKHNAQTLGGKLIQAYYCLGEYDVIAIWEFPDNKTAMKAAVLNASLGHIEITTMPAVDREEWKSLLQQTIGKK